MLLQPCSMVLSRISQYTENKYGYQFCSKPRFAGSNVPDDGNVHGKNSGLNERSGKSTPFLAEATVAVPFNCC